MVAPAQLTPAQVVLEQDLNVAQAPLHGAVQVRVPLKVLMQPTTKVPAQARRGGWKPPLPAFIILPVAWQACMMLQLPAA